MSTDAKMMLYYMLCGLSLGAFFHISVWVVTRVIVWVCSALTSPLR